MKNISILGLGNISFELCSALVKQGFNVFGSTDNYHRQVRLKKLGVKIFSRSNIGQCILKADKLIITIPPDNFGCKIINTYSKEIIAITEDGEIIGLSLNGGLLFSQFFPPGPEKTVFRSIDVSRNGELIYCIGDDPVGSWMSYEGSLINYF